MASRAVRALSRESALELAQASADGRGLAVVVLAFNVLEADNLEQRFALGHMVYARQGGFMLIFPLVEAVQVALFELDHLGHPEGVLTKDCEVELETPRGRALGTSVAMLVDVPSEMVGHFCNSSAARARGMTPSNTMQFLVERTMARPIKASTFAQADAWITSTMDHDTAQDYLTGEEELEPVEDPAGAEAQPQEVAELQARVRDLEAMLQQQGTTPAVIPAQMGIASSVGAKPKAPPLFGAAASSTMTSAEWTKLQQLAGSPPPRVAGAEKRRTDIPAAVAEQDGFLAQMEKEADDQEQLEASLAAVQSDGSLHQVMLAQLKQNQILLQRLTAPKHQDPVLGALAGGGDGSSSTSSGVKGMLAREAFIKAIQEIPKVAALCQQRALAELGFDESKLDGALMRRYVERRVPLAENRQLTYLAFMMAEAWASGHESNNVELQGWICKMMIFIEQTCLDGGRMNLAWLLTGQQDPPFHLLVQNKRRPGLQPFTRLASPSWVSANLAYVRDLDVLESKMLTMGKGDKTKIKPDEQDGETDPIPKRQPRPGKGKKRGKEDQGQSASEAGQ